MGAEFIEKTKQSFLKKWNRERVRLATAELFTRTPEAPARNVAADLVDGCTLEQGAQVIVEKNGDGYVARQGNAVVGRLRSPSPETQKGIEQSGGVSGGAVKKIHPLSRVAEIALW